MDASTASSTGTAQSRSAIQATEHSPLLATHPKASASADDHEVQSNTHGYLVYPSRFIVLLLFVAMAQQQVQLWITYGTVAKETMEFYKVSALQVDILQAYGPIAFFPSMAFTSWLLERHGLRATVICGALLETAGAGIRVFGAWGGGYFALVHIGQFLNGFCGPMMAAPPAMISERWFQPERRTTATAVGSMAGGIGAACAFLLIPYLVHTHDMQFMLACQFGISAAILLALLAYFPEHPPTPPSATSAGPRVNLRASWYAVRGSKAFWILSLAGGVSSGMFNGWTSVLSLILNTKEGFTDSSLWKDFFHSSSWIGFASGLLSLFGAIFIAGPITDCFPRFLKLVIIIPFVLATVLFLLFAMANQGTFFHASSLLKFCTAVAASAVLSVAGPLFYEALAEATYPVPEAISVMMMLGMNNVACLVFQVIGMCGVIQDASKANIMNWLMAAASAACTILMVFHSQEYRRLDVDRASR